MPTTYTRTERKVSKNPASAPMPSGQSEQIKQISSALLILPYAVKDVAVGIDSDVKVGLNDFVELAVFLVPEKCVWHPDLLGVCHGEVLDASIHVIESQPVVVPLLTERDLNTVFLKSKRVG